MKKHFGKNTHPCRESHPLESGVFRETPGADDPMVANSGYSRKVDVCLQTVKTGRPQVVHTVVKHDRWQEPLLVMRGFRIEV